MSICVIEPHPNQWRGMLAQSHITPQRVEEIKIEKIEVDITRQTWRIFLAEEILDGTVLQDLEQAFRDLCPQLQGISFVSPPRGDDEGAYLERILRENQQQPLVSLPEIQSDVLIGRGIKGEPRPIKEIVDEERSITIKGQVISLEVQELRSGRTLLTFDITDYTDSITAKIFLKDGEPVPERLQKGQWITVRGPVEIDRYSQELVLMAKDISLAERPKRVDNAPVKRTELHFHTKMSSMDATAELKAAMQVAADWGHEALAITDHGVVQAFPEAYELGRALGLKVIYGTEGYLVEKEREDPSYHIILLAQNQRGLKNLYKLISLAHLKYFYRQPRIPREEIMKHREGLILGSACERGEVYQAILRGASDEELINIAKFYDYLEIQPLANNRFLVREGRVSSEEELQQINRRIVELAQQLNIPVVATGDVHFVHPEDAIYRQILLAGQGYADVEHQAPLYLRTTEEMLEEFAYLGPEVAYKVVVEDPKGIVASIEELQPIPDGLHTPHMPGAEESITETAYRRARELYGQELPPLVEARLERELRAICDNGYAPLYLIAQKLVEKSLSDGYLVGSRGSVGSSLVATLCNITEVNPLPPHYLCPSCHYSEFIDDGSVGVGVDLDDQDCPDCGQTMDKLGFDIPFEVFMGFHGDKVPDIDLNFSGEYQPIIHKYTEELFGPEYVYRAGTISTLADRTAYGFVRKFLDEHDIQVRDAELNRLVQGCSGVKRTTGQHPGGLMVVPNDRDIFDFSPI
ncbi:MAG: PHP domain-containing protein, partial [Limnochordia bacterium]